jgi:hypothetical protein
MEGDVKVSGYQNDERSLQLREYKVQVDYPFHHDTVPIDVYQDLFIEELNAGKFEK